MKLKQIQAFLNSSALALVLAFSAQTAKAEFPNFPYPLTFLYCEFGNMSGTKFIKTADIGLSLSLKGKNLPQGGQFILATQPYSTVVEVDVHDYAVVEAKELFKFELTARYPEKSEADKKFKPLKLTVYKKQLSNGFKQTELKSANKNYTVARCK